MNSGPPAPEVWGLGLLERYGVSQSVLPIGSGPVFVALGDTPCHWVNLGVPDLVTSQSTSQSPGLTGLIEDFCSGFGPLRTGSTLLSHHRLHSRRWHLPLQASRRRCRSALAARSRSECGSLGSFAGGLCGQCPCQKPSPHLFRVTPRGGRRGPQVPNGCLTARMGFSIEILGSIPGRVGNDQFLRSTDRGPMEA